MRILVDENIPNITVSELRTLGHDVLDIRGTQRQGMFDDELWSLAQAEQRILVTTDKGFSEYRDEPHCGICSQCLDRRIPDAAITWPASCGNARNSLGRSSRRFTNDRAAASLLARPKLKA